MFLRKGDLDRLYVGGRVNGLAVPSATGETFYVSKAGASPETGRFRRELLLSVSADASDAMGPAEVLAACVPLGVQPMSRVLVERFPGDIGFGFARTAWLDGGVLGVTSEKLDVDAVASGILGTTVDSSWTRKLYENPDEDVCAWYLCNWSVCDRNILISSGGAYITGDASCTPEYLVRNFWRYAYDATLAPDFNGVAVTLL